MIALETRDCPAGEWLEVARVRSSRRKYDGATIEPAALEALASFVDTHRPAEVARAVVIREAPDDIFRGVIGGYGRVGGAPSALAFIGAAGAPAVDECVGYTGEAAVLEATRLGLDTCWIAGTFKAGRVARHVGLKAGEKVFAVSPLGHATPSLGFGERTILGHRTIGPRPRRSSEEIAPGNGSWPGWARAGVEAARLAPSAMNRQPWRFAYADGRVTVSYDGADAYVGVSKKLDCGIAMLHFEIGARHAGGAGHWELPSSGNKVARYILG